MVEDYVNEARERDLSGRFSAPEGPRRRVACRLREGDIARLKQLASQLKLSQGDTIALALRQLGKELLQRP